VVERKRKILRIIRRIIRMRKVRRTRKIHGKLIRKGDLIALTNQILLLTTIRVMMMKMEKNLNNMIRRSNLCQIPLRKERLTIVNIGIYSYKMK